MPNLKDAFNHIYVQGQWGEPFSSGTGSHYSPLVNAYVDCVTRFLTKLPIKNLTALDIGCGDFNIGKRVYPIFDSYLAVDVSDIIIEKNRANFSSPKLRFEEMNAITDTIPYADVIFMRQVFQHLGNEDIQLILDKVSLSCKVLIVTEHQPAFEFVPNIDHPSGSISNRKVDSNSGVVITSAPFSFSHSGEVTLLDYFTDIGRFLTKSYQFTELYRYRNSQIHGN